MAEARTRYEKETNIARDILILGLLPNKVKTLVNEMRKKVVVVDGKVRFRA
jgi:hypothetical protein